MHDAVEVTERVPRLARERDGGVEVTEVDGPELRVRGVDTALREHRLRAGRCRRAAMPTVAPRAASIGASAAPIPDDAPVTRIFAPSTLHTLLTIDFVGEGGERTSDWNAATPG